MSRRYASAHDDTPRIYVACLAAYTSGSLHGCWIDLDQDLDEVWDEVRAMLAESPAEGAEEFAIHDYEYFHAYSVGEYEPLEELVEIAEFLEEAGNAELASHLVEEFGLERAKTELEENYRGSYDSLTDFAEELTEDTSEVPEHLAYYIDYEKMGRDLQMGGEVRVYELGSETHVFWNR